jgi:hypothetical protein
MTSDPTAGHGRKKTAHVQSTAACTIAAATTLPVLLYVLP